MGGGGVCRGGGERKGVGGCSPLTEGLARGCYIAFPKAVQGSVKVEVEVSLDVRGRHRSSMPVSRFALVKFNEDEYIIGTVILAQDVKLARQRHRIAQLEAAILQLRESAVLAYDCMLADDT